uniref:Uncharacterized protein n=1 Tax=Arundo donax TaxID=35708 RepID=A0A0A9BII3_ARUDO
MYAITPHKYVIHAPSSTSMAIKVPRGQSLATEE